MCSTSAHKIIASDMLHPQNFSEYFDNVTQNKKDKDMKYMYTKSARQLVRLTNRVNFNMPTSISFNLMNAGNTINDTFISSSSALRPYDLTVVMMYTLFN